MVAALVAATVFCSWLATPEVHSQGPAVSTANASLTPLLAKLKAQQDQITGNQTKIEAQTAVLKEELRQAKIYSGRGGAGRR